ncbi:MAG: Mini-ribonuclease 3 [Zhaonellaceae bacterium]|jgi:ribonuclease-3 family protein
MANMHFPTYLPPVEKPEQISPLALAYIGDAVLELYVRTYLVWSGKQNVNILHKNAVQFVNASIQAKLLKSLEDDLTEEEITIAKRGRNAKSGHAPKNADMLDYRFSTGLECLIGYLYLKEDYRRLDEIFKILLQIVEEGKTGDAGNTN